MPEGDPPPPRPHATLYCRGCASDLLPVFVDASGRTFITGRYTPDGNRIYYARFVCWACGRWKVFESIELEPPID